MNFIYVPLQRIFDELRYFINFFKIKNILKKYSQKMLSDKECLDLIINQKKSLARFGDGEFKWMLNINQISFQEFNIELQKKLLEVFYTDNDKLLIGLPKAFETMDGYNHSAKRYWSNFILKYFDVVFNLIQKSKNKIFVNASITRPYMDYKDKSECKKRFDNLKSIWNEKDVIIVEGEMSKLGMGNDLFSNTRSLKRIICPSQNAFSKYDEILKCILKQDKNKLILLSLGPTATILACDLCNSGYQAVDIGHIDIEYEWFKIHATKKIKINGKHTNEASGKDKTNIYNDNKEYKESIIAQIV